MPYFPSHPQGVPTPEQAAKLADRIKKGDIAARNELVERSMGLAVQLSKRYRRRVPSHNEELICEATLGLMDAANKFDPKRGAFATVAGNYIRRRCLDYLRERVDLIRVPRGTQDYIKLGRHGEDSEIAKAFKALKDSPVYSLSGNLRHGCYREDDGFHFSDPIDPKAEDPAAQADHRARILMINEIIDGMSKKQAAMVRRRHGLGCEPESYEKLAHRHGRVKEWARTQFRDFIYPELKKRLSESGVAG